VDILFSLDINEWGGKRSVQLTVKDVHHAESERRENERAEARFREILAGDDLETNEDVVPNRDDFAAVYTVIRRMVRCGTDTVSARSMHSQLYAAGHPIGKVKLKLIFSIFREMNILGIEEIEPEKYLFRLKFSTTKTDLEKSNILHQLRQREKRR
jgi:hypothetical protein